LRRDIIAEQFNPQKVQQGPAAWQTASHQFLAQISTTLVEALAPVSLEESASLSPP